jgi:Tfp pilus assembly protein PilN
MQEINLLQNKVKDRTLQYEKSNRLVIGLFTMLMLLEVAAFGGLYYLNTSTKSKITAVKVENTKIQNDINSNKTDVTKAQGLQAQLKNVRTLLVNHVSWGSFFDRVGSVTPDNIQIRGINGAASDGKFHVEGLASSYQDIGRLLLALATSDNFDSVKLRNVSPGTTAKFGYGFSMELVVKPNIFKK